MFEGRRTRQVVLDLILKEPQGLRARVNAKCVECIYDEYQPGTWRAQVEKCTSSTCPLFPVRPRSRPGRLPADED